MRPVSLSLSLRRALLHGAGLALLSSCGGTVGTPGDDGTGGTTNTGGGVATGGAPSAGGASTGGAGTGGEVLPAPPEEECIGEDMGDGPYYGRCCSELLCREPGDDGRCLPADSEELRALPGFPPGSGSCNCSETQGPFARPTAPILAQGDCCYAVYSIGCDGRPLRRDDFSLVLAAVVRRSDWGTRRLG